jgi:hypothetical protein
MEKKDKERITYKRSKETFEETIEDRELVKQTKKQTNK